jgi:ABC-type Fe3+-hydroxamate transport system substrate-binding protein
MARLHRVIVLFALPLALATGACASLGSPSISEVQANPGRYTDRTVTVSGTVTTAWSIPLVPYKMYRVTDGTSEILVLSDGRGRGAPSRGARVRVRGEVQEVAVFGGRSVGLHLREKSLKVL